MLTQSMHWCNCMNDGEYGKSMDLHKTTAYIFLNINTGDFSWSRERWIFQSPDITSFEISLQTSNSDTTIKYSFLIGFWKAKYLSLASFMMPFYGIPISPLKLVLECCTPKWSFTQLLNVWVPIVIMWNEARWAHSMRRPWNDDIHFFKIEVATKN